MAEAKTIEDQNARLMRRATYASVSVAGMLIAVKSAAWLLTDSIAMLSTLIDSLFDAAASLVNLIAVGQALKPADRAHRFGHGKAEPLAGLGHAALIAGSAAFLLFEAGHRLFQPRPIDNSAIGIGVMVFAIVLTLVLVRFQRHVVGKTKSVAISADSLHYVSDLLVNIGVIYQFDGDPNLTPDEQALNDGVVRVSADPQGPGPKRWGIIVSRDHPSRP